MNFKYAPLDRWRKHAKHAIYNMLFQFVLVVGLWYLNTTVSKIVVYLAFAAIAESAFRAVYYMNMSQREYVRLYDDYLTVHRGLLDSRKKVRFHDIIKVSKVHNVLSVRTYDGDGEDIYVDQLTERDRLLLLDELEKRANVRATKLEEHEVDQYVTPS